MNPLRLSDFDYQYPRELIAKYPAEPKDAARLMVIHRQSGLIEHRHVRDLPDYFNAGDVMVVNDTKVFPARLFAAKEADGVQNVEVFILREINARQHLWDCIVEPARKVRVGNKLYFDNGLEAEVIDNTTSRGRIVRFIFEGNSDELMEKLDGIGHTPIPPYLKRPDDTHDSHRYQTIFAQKRGAVAAPTAGLHFTPEILAELQLKGVQPAPVTLHVGLGTFRSVEVEDLTKHNMDSEQYHISTQTAQLVNDAISNHSGKVTVVGTTCVRAVESSLTAARLLRAGEGWTDKFIFPDYEFAITQQLITNFHMPKSTLMMLVAAFSGYELMMEAYQKAVEMEYRLFSYGDAMIII
jgi:S-adenosylmethionine:tRNA ribosyltransferase-isomerase